MEQLLLLLGDYLRRVDGAFVVWVFNRCSLVGMLKGAHRISLFAGDRDDSAASWHLEDIVTMMSHCHELGQGRIPKDGVVRQADVGDVEVNELGAVVVAGSEGDREADLPDWNCGAVGDSRERLGWLKLIVRHLEIVKCLYGQNVEPCPAVLEQPTAPSNLDIHAAQP